MERKRNFANVLIIGILFFGFVSKVLAHQNSLNQRMYKNYIAGKLQEWEYVITEFEGSGSRSNNDYMQLLNYYYGYTAWLVSNSFDDKAEEYIEKSSELIQKLLESKYEVATMYAYRGAFYGFEIGKSPYKAISLGPKSNEAIAKSLELDANNIQGYIEKGNAAYYTPSLFGGSKEAALEAYKKAIFLMEKQGAAAQNWLYMNTLVMLAQCYERTGFIERAERTYERILKLEPDFIWVRDELYPEFCSVHNRE